MPAKVSSSRFWYRRSTSERIAVSRTTWIGSESPKPKMPVLPALEIENSRVVAPAWKSFVPDSEMPIEIWLPAFSCSSRSAIRPPQPSALRSSGTLVCHCRIWSEWE